MKPALYFLLVICLALPAAAGKGHKTEPELTIISAQYGAGDKRIDVADLFRPLISHGCVFLSARWGLGNPDPAPGVIKDVKFVYRANGKVRSAAFRQDQDIILVPATSGLFIINASYGTPSRCVDVTEAVRAVATTDSLQLPPRWGLGRVDPAAGTVKTVEITYLYSNTLNTASFKQTQEIKLPPPPSNDPQEFLVSFPNRPKSGEQIVGFELRIQNGRILTVNNVPYDWSIRLLAEAPGSQIRGLPNHGASAFQDMVSLQRFVTVQQHLSSLELSGYVVVTKDFTREWTNLLTTSDFILEKATPNSPPALPVWYHNAKFGLTFFLAASWQGYSVLMEQWESVTHSPTDGKRSVVGRGPMIILRHPQWKAGDIYQDIPILVFTRAQWDALNQGKLWPSLYAGGVIDELWHNRDYVFAMSSRYNAADEAKACKEVSDIVEQNRATNKMPPLYSE
jgi:hypothetical protein